MIIINFSNNPINIIIMVFNTNIIMDTITFIIKVNIINIVTIIVVTNIKLINIIIGVKFIINYKINSIINYFTFIIILIIILILLILF